MLRLRRLVLILSVVSLVLMLTSSAYAENGGVVDKAMTAYSLRIR